MIAEYDNGAAPGSPSREYIYSGAALLAKIDSTGTHYYHQDHLSNRLTTTSSGGWPILPSDLRTEGWGFLSPGSMQPPPSPPFEPTDPLAP